MNTYYTIYRHQDNLHTAGPLTQDELNQRLNAEEDGYKNYRFLDDIPDLEYFPSKSIVVIKGEIVQPKVEEVVTRLSV